MWTLDEGLVVARSLEPVAVAFGYHVALGGGVLLRGASEKDLDVMLYPHGGDKIVLNTLGFHNTLNAMFKDFSTASKYGPDHTVYRGYCRDTGKRVDFFFLRRSAE